MQYQVIRERAKIGKNCDIRNFVFIDNDVEIGDNCKIMDGAKLYRGVKLGNDVFVGPGVIFANDNYPDNKTIRNIEHTWKVDDYAAIGAGSIILADINIGADSLIGAGSVVTSNVEPGAIYAGNPAKLLRWRWDYE